MQWSAFHLARRVAQGPYHRWPLVVAGVIAGVLVPVLMIDLGLIVQLQVSRVSTQVPHDWVLGPLVTSPAIAWPLFGSYRICLAALVAFGGLVALAQACAMFALRRGAHALALKTSTDLRYKIYTQAFRLGPYDLLGATRTRPEELFSEKVETIRRGLVYWWTAVPQAFVALVLLLILAAGVDGWLTLLAVLLAACVLRAYRAIRRHEDAHRQHWRAKVRHIEAILSNSLHLAPLLKGYSLIEPPGDVFENALRENAKAELQLVRGEYLLRPVLFLGVLLAAGVVALVIGLGDGPSLAGTIVLCGSLLTAWFPFARLNRLQSAISEMDTAANEVCVFLDREPSVVQLAEAKPLDRLSQSISFDRVWLADRHGRHLLEEVTFQIPAGKRIALVASDLQTPPAVAGLLVRFYDPTAGRLLFDDHDIQRATLDTIRGQTALVFKNGLLFQDTILRNITCGDSGFTTPQINDAIKRAAADFVRELPEGVSTTVGFQTPLLRPDQSFRIGLARALLRAPSLLVIEEPLGSGEELVERELDDALAQAAESRTLIILPARINTLRNAELVLVFHEGKLVAQGKHADLLQASELYRHLVYVRFNPYRDTVR